MPHITVALIGWKEVKYDVCSENTISDTEKQKDNLEYLGRWTIFSINWTRQDIDNPVYESEKNYNPVEPKKLYFYKKK